MFQRQTLTHTAKLLSSALTLALFSQLSFANTDGNKKPDLEKAKQTATTVCAACHGADGNSAIPVNPSLAGQHADYLLKQLQNFKSVNGKPAERNNAVMGGMVANLSVADMQGLAAYFSQQKLKLAVASGNKASLALGEKVWRGGNQGTGVAACAACHSANGAGMPAQFPRLSGQHAAYIEAQLNSFRAGTRANDQASVMRTIALRMTDAEIKAVADYAAGLR